jgi:hypothetical protein
MDEMRLVGQLSHLQEGRRCRHLMSLDGL